MTTSNARNSHTDTAQSRDARFDVEDYIANAPDRKPRFTEADLRVVAERVREQVAREIRADMRTINRHQSHTTDAIWSAYDHAAYIAVHGTDAL